jgi:undecaprenyl-diphosphatase
MKHISNESKIKLVVISILFVVIATLTILVYTNGKGPLGIDVVIRDFFYSIRGEKGGIIYWITRAITELGDIFAVIVLILLIGILTKFDERFYYIALVALSMHLLNSGFKHIVMRPRPLEEFRWQEYNSATSFSFPSGHSTTAGAMYTTLLLLTLKSQLSDKIKLTAKIAFPTIIVVVMITRLILGVHYFSDVVAGASVGALIALSLSFSLPLLNKLCNWFYSKLKQVFAKYTTGGIMRYYKKLKIKEARRLIRESQYNMTQISDLLQFDSPQYFTRCFKEVSNMTPSEYKASIIRQ